MTTGNRALARSLAGTSLGAISLLLAGAATAQTQPPPPPQPVNVDGNGVDLSSRTLVMGQVDLAIGPGDHRGLQLVRQWAEQGWRIASTPVISGSTSDPVVVVGGRSARFSWDNTQSRYVPAAQDGSSLSSDMAVFTASDGTVIAFQNVTGLSEHPTAMRAASKITFADGVEHTFTYQSIQLASSQPGVYFTKTRLISVNSSTGYQLKLKYHSNDTSKWNYLKLAGAAAINNAAEYCDPAADTCSLSGDWPEITYAGGNGWLAGITSATDPEGRTTAYGYDTSGTKINTITPPGTGASPVTFTYGSEGIDAVTRGGGTWSYSEQQSGSYRIVTVESPEENTNTFTFSENGLLRFQSLGGDVTGFEYCTGTVTCPFGRIRKITAPEGNYTTFTYDARGNVTSRTSHSKPDPNANPLTSPGPDPAYPAITTSAVYPINCANPVTCNKPESVTDAKGKVTDFTWSATHGGLRKIERPADPGGIRPTTVFTYEQVQARYLDGPGSWTTSPPIWAPDLTHQCRTAATCYGTADERVTNLNYDPASTPNNALPAAVRMSIGDESIGQYTTLSYTELGDLASVNGPVYGDDDVTAMFYNKARQPTGSIGPGDSTYDHLASRTIYDDAGRPWKQEYGHTSGNTEADLAAMTFRGRTLTRYDSHGRPEASFAVDANGNAFSASQVGYDAAGRTTCVAQRMDPASAYAGPMGDPCVAATTSAYGPDRIAKYSYDDRGRITKVTSGFDTDDAADSYTVTFTPNGQIATAMDAQRNLTTYEYDGHDRNYKVRFPVLAQGAEASSSTDYEQYAFDDNGNVTSFRTRAGETIAMNYDNLNRLTSKIVPERTDGSLPADATRDVYYAYDLFGNLTSARFWGQQGGQGLTFAYDGLGRQIEETRFGLGADTTVRSGYHPKTNLRISMKYPDLEEVVYSYDVMGRPETITLGGVNALKYTYRQDGLPEKLERWRDTGSWDMATTFSFNDASRMSALAHDPAGTASDAAVSFSHNPAGQIFQRTQANDAYAHPAPANSAFDYVSNGLNQYESADSAAFTYDANGNLTSDGDNTFVYDAENRLHKRIDAEGKTATMWYDPLGRLYMVNSSEASPRNYVYDGDALIAQYNWDGSSMLSRYLHGAGAGIDDPLVQFEGSGTALANREYLYADERGSIVAMGGADGIISASDINTYDAYGVQLPGNSGTFRYTGQVYIPEMDLYYYKARMYSPYIGRFMQTDPIGYGDGMNMYRYVGNDPVNGVDPTGLSCRIYRYSNIYTDSNGVIVMGWRYEISGCNGGGQVDNRHRVGGGGGQTSRAREEPQNEICDAPLRGGGTIRQNASQIRAYRARLTQNAHMVGWTDADVSVAVTSNFVGSVMPGGRWAGRLGEPGGNWNYGAVGRAAGFSLEFLLRTAGAAEQLEALTGRTGSGETGQGHPFGGPPYGDNPVGQAQITEGFNAGC